MVSQCVTLETPRNDAWQQLSPINTCNTTKSREMSYSKNEFHEEQGKRMALNCSHPPISGDRLHCTVVKSSNRCSNCRYSLFSLVAHMHPFYMIGSLVL